MGKQSVKDVSPAKYDPQTFLREVYSVVAAIPAGRVVSYGDIAHLVGQPNRSRMVGRALRSAPEIAGLPCHRVVNNAGRLAPGWAAQRQKLTDEGVSFRRNGYVDIRKHRWRYNETEK